MQLSKYDQEELVDLILKIQIGDVIGLFMSSHISFDASSAAFYINNETSLIMDLNVLPVITAAYVDFNQAVLLIR